MRQPSHQERPGKVVERDFTSGAPHCQACLRKDLIPWHEGARERRRRERQVPAAGGIASEAGPAPISSPRFL